MSRLAFFMAAMVTACSWEGTWGEPTPGLQRMVQQPRGDTYAPSSFFADGMTMRVPPEGTVPWGAEVREAPPKLDEVLLARGQNRYETFCAPCHGLDARGDTVIAEDMSLRRPPALIEAPIVALSDAALHAVITEGYGLMPSYAGRLDPSDRWAVVAYVRALQLAAGAPINWLSIDERMALTRSSS